MGYCSFLSWDTAGAYHGALQAPIMWYCRFLSWGTVGSYNGALQVPYSLGKTRIQEHQKQGFDTKHTKQSSLLTVQWPQSTNVPSSLHLQHTNAYSDRPPY